MHPLVLAERAAGEEVIFGHRADLDLQQEILVAGDVPRAGDFRMAGDLAREAVHRLRPRLFHPHQHMHDRSEEHTSELQSLMRISYAVFCLKKKTPHITHNKE